MKPSLVEENLLDTFAGFIDELRVEEVGKCGDVSKYLGGAHAKSAEHACGFV